MTDEYSEGGDPIYRYKEREEGWTPPDMEDNSLEEIDKHITTHIGKIDTVWHEIISDVVHIDVHQIAPTDDRPYWTLVTSGMSDLPMPAPDGSEAWRHAELMLCLPREWPIGDEEFKKQENYWPVYWLKMLARFPHEYNAWMAWGHTMPNGDPAEPFCEGVDFTGIILLGPRTVSSDFHSLKVRDDKVIHFYSVVPLYTEEMDLKLKQGADHIDQLLDQNKVTEIVSVGRPSIASGKWWKFW